MFYSIVRGFLRIIFYFLGLKVEGLDNLPPSGAVIIAANHVSNWDPVVLALALNRPVHFMGKSELFKYTIFNKLFRALHAFPVRKDIPDRQSIRQALQVLAAGEVLGIFPEGGRNARGNLQVQSGVIMIAEKSGAPIVPIACLGTKRSLPWGWSEPLIVRLGEPIHLQISAGNKLGTVGREKLSLELMSKINSLLEQ
jgi:1-acyl-sn-glycerol-3-phosphate acyltransferase